jgi:hypothetical protein
MASISLGTIAFLCAMFGSIAGIALRERLPRQHLTDEAQELVKLAAGLIGTMVALVLGLLIASASASYDAESDNLDRLGSDLVLLDREFEQFGPEGLEARALLRDAVHGFVRKIDQGGISGHLQSREVTNLGRELLRRIRDLVPKTDSQRNIQEQALAVITDLARVRWNLTQGRDNPIPIPFQIILMTWIAALFLCFGLLAPRNSTIITVLFVCALTVAGGLALIVELGDPFDGFLQLSLDPLRDAAQMLTH